MSRKDPEMATFGAVLGVAPGNVTAHSSDYDSAGKEEFPNRHSYRSYVDGIFMGYKWQCVEFARRWMYLNYGYIFDDVAMAYDIFRLRHVRRIKDNALLPLKSFKNGSQRHPQPGCLLIWNEGGEFKVTGHVAVVTEVALDHIRIVEQNVDHKVWPRDQNYSRQLQARVSQDGGYWIRCSYHDSDVLGWMIQTEDGEHAEVFEDPDPALFNLKMLELDHNGQHQKAWLNEANPDDAAYVAMMKGHKLTGVDADQYKYFCMSETAKKELKRATNELHALFMHATNYVLQDDALLEKFNLPRALWPKIHQSWDNRRNQMITGRFDFSMSEHGIKVYEYNADSASCYMECGEVQTKWADHFGCDTGDCAGEDLYDKLVDAWRRSKVDSTLHIMQDRDLEETYHALFMKAAMERAGLHCKIITGVKGLSWAEDGRVLDADGEPINWVWKTWAWETALDQIREECEDDEEKLRTYKVGQNRAPAPRLVDVLLRPEVMVYEPLWTLIPSNKAILPVLWLLFPNHPYLLNASFDITPQLQDSGYVNKPIAGRCGFNVSVVDSNNNVLKETGGRFGHQDNIYQALCPLPKLQGYNTQMCTFSVDGSYAGACVRVDPSLVITTNSDVMALRVVNDREFGRL